MPTLPDARKLTEWERNVEVWKLAEREGLDAVADIPRIEQQHWYELIAGMGYVRHSRLINQNFQPYRGTFAFWFFGELRRARIVVEEYLNRWQDRFVALEWKFRSRIEEEE
jgi:hypothetical protein